MPLRKPDLELYKIREGKKHGSQANIGPPKVGKKPIRKKTKRFWKKLLMLERERRGSVKIGSPPG